jgi:ABC-2 type transport system ATP-binding protein
MIRIDNVVKDYGSLRAVDHLDFTINDGEILGFLGPNGAGNQPLSK